MTATDSMDWTREALAVQVARLGEIAASDFADIQAAHDAGDTAEAIRLMVASQRQIMQAGTVAQGLLAHVSDVDTAEDAQRVHEAINAAQDALSAGMLALGYRFDLVAPEEATR